MDQTGSRKPLIIGSAVALVIGATIMIFLHETAHAVTAMILGHHPMQIPFAVDYSAEPPVDDRVIILLAAPAFSLFSGLIGVIVDRIATPFRQRPFWRMVWLWTIFTSIQEGLGYLQITAIFQAGDTAQAFDLLEAPTIAYVLVTVIGWACLPLTAWLFAVPMWGMAAAERDKTDLAVWPWMIGTGGLLLLMLGYVLLSPVSDPSVIVAVLAGALAVGVYAPMSMMFGSKRCDAAESPVMPWPPVGGIALLVILVALNLSLLLGWLWP